MIEPQEYMEFVLDATKTVAEGLVRDEDFMAVSFVMSQSGRMQVIGLPGFPSEDVKGELQELKKQIREANGRMASFTAMAALSIEEEEGVTKPADGLVTTFATPEGIRLSSAYITKWETRKLTVGEWRTVYEGPFQPTLGNVATCLHDAITPLP